MVAWPVEARLANLPPCRIGMEACVGAHHLSRTLTALGHDARLMPAKYVRPYSKDQKNDYRDAEANQFGVGQHGLVKSVPIRSRTRPTFGARALRYSI
jgi:transposase